MTEVAKLQAVSRKIDDIRFFDNTMLTAYKRCPRYYFFRHEMHLETSGAPRVPLVFGGAWHAAMDVIWPNLTKMEHGPLTRAAFDAFMWYWTSEGMPADIDYETERELSPRTPGRALEMIAAYIDKRSKTADDFELIAVETPFAVPLDAHDPNLFYIGKIDKIVKHHSRRTKILGIEHKTTTAYKKFGPFRSAFLDSFSPNSQVDGYLYALHMSFPEQVGGVWVDAALVHKQEEGFTFIPVERQMTHLDSWLWEVKWWIEQVEWQRLKIVSGDASNHKYMQAFPKNTNSCFDFNASCTYLDLCKAWPNPLGFDVPLGFVQQKWNPLEHIKGVEQLMQDTKA